MEDRMEELRQCQQEVRELTRRVNALSARIDALSAERKPVVPALPKPVVQLPPKPAEEQPRTPLGERNLENAVGRNLFAVLASLLVLLGVGVFISTIYAYIPQIVKILAIYLFGGILLGIGLLIYRKNSNKFWLGVASCGLAELLVSVIASHTYFEVLPLLPTFGLVLVWIVGSLWLTKFHPTVFKTIGYIGFQFSMLLGLSLLGRQDLVMYMTLVAAYGVLAVFFTVSNRGYTVMNTAMAFANVIGLYMFNGMPDYLPEGWGWVSGPVALALLTVFHAAYLFPAKLESKAYPAFSIATVLILAVFLQTVDEAWMAVILLTVIFAQWVACFKTVAEPNCRLVYTLFGILLVIAIAIGGTQGELWAFYGWFPVFTLLALGLYRLTRSPSAGWLGIACFLGFWWFAVGEDASVHLCCMAAALVIFGLHSSKLLRQDAALRTAWYAVAFLMAHTLYEDLTMHIGWEDLQLRALAEGGFCMLLALVNTAYLHICTRDPEQILKKTYHGIAVKLLQGYLFLRCLDAVDSGLWYVALLGVLSSMLTISHSLWYTCKLKGQHRKLVVWQFVKFTLYCWVVLLMLNCPSVLMHISLLLIAIFAIVLGFRLGHKSVRVYGLVLSLLDVVSLVLFNIDFRDSLQLAGGIILCGGLCFVISFIYSRISKSQEKQQV